MTKVKCDDGKYTFIVRDGKNKLEIAILLCGDEWIVDGVLVDNGFTKQDVFPWKAIHSLIYKCEQQENKIRELEAEIFNLNCQISEM